MADSWPTDLPSRMIIRGAAGQFGENAIRSQVDVGPAKMRRRSTANPDTYSGSQYLNADQYEDLETFGKTTLGGWVLPFTWVHPITGDAVDMRFLSPPKYTPVGGQMILAAYHLEILP